MSVGSETTQNPFAQNQFWPMNGLSFGGALLYLRKGALRLGAVALAAPGRLDPSRCGRGAKRALNGPNEVELIKRLLNRHCARLKRPDR